MRVGDAVRPLTHGFAHRILQSRGTRGHGNHLGAEQSHSIDVERLTLGILLAHENDALHAHQSSGSRGRDTVLTCTSLGNQADLAHLFGQQRLTENVVDFVRTRVIEILSLEINLRSAKILCHLLGIIEPRRSSRIVVEQVGQLAVEVGIVFVVVIGFLQLNYGVHQGFGNVLSPVYAEPSIRIRHSSSSFLTAAANAVIFSMSFTPSVSMPVLTSTA